MKSLAFSVRSWSARHKKVARKGKSALLEDERQDSACLAFLPELSFERQPSAFKHLDVLAEMHRLLPKQLTVIDEISERCKYLPLLYARPVRSIINQFLSEKCEAMRPAKGV